MNKLFTTILWGVTITGCSTLWAKKEDFVTSKFTPGSIKHTSAIETNLNTSNTNNMIFVSYYGHKDGLEGKKTASGEALRLNELTAAHRTLPFGTIVSLTNPQNGKSIKVRINDRGPFTKDRQLDVSYGAAKALDIIKQGEAILSYEVLRDPNENLHNSGLKKKK